MRKSGLFAAVVVAASILSSGPAKAGTWSWLPINEGLHKLISDGAKIITSESGDVTGRSIGGTLGNVYLLRSGKKTYKCVELYYVKKTTSEPTIRKQSCYALSPN